MPGCFKCSDIKDVEYAFQFAYGGAFDTHAYSMNGLRLRDLLSFIYNQN